MRLILVSPWDNAWVPYYKAECLKRGHEFSFQRTLRGNERADVVLHGWANGDSRPLPGARNVMFLRRHELFDGGLGRVQWKHVDALVCVNTWIAERVREVFANRELRVPVHVVYNGLNPELWTFKVRKPGKMIGMACHIHPKKNLPLALQILAALPQDYELHIAGQVQDPCTAEYLNHVGNAIRRRIYFYGHIEHRQLDLWWEQMNYCLSTSLSEGNPNNAIEAMAKGVKPIIHDWPGAEDQFLPWMRFRTAAEAAHMIASEEYGSEYYRDLVRAKFSTANYERVMDICESFLTKEKAA